MAEPQKSKSHHPENDVNAPNLIERAKEETKAVVQSERSPHQHKEASGISHHSGKSPRHDKETHGLNADIDEDTPIDEVKGPGVFERVKEEVEAIVEAILPKKK